MAFAPDGQPIAFARRRRLQLLSADDGSEVRVSTLPHPLQWMRFNEEGDTLIGMTTHAELIRVATSDGAVQETRDLSGLREANQARTRAVVCRDGLVHLVWLDEERERGPLGRCPGWGRFVFGETERYVGWVGGAVTRVHRVSDGEALTLRSVWLRRPLPPIQIAFSDTGFFEAVHARPTHLRVREGGISDAEMQSVRDNPHERPGLVEAFFGGEPLSPSNTASPSDTTREEGE